MMKQHKLRYMDLSSTICKSGSKLDFCLLTLCHCENGNLEIGVHQESIVIINQKYTFTSQHKVESSILFNKTEVLQFKNISPTLL